MSHSGQNNKARRMGKQSRSKAGKPSNAAQPEPPTACGGGSSSGGIVSSTRLFTKGDLLKRDQASLVLVRRSTGQSEWAFAERAANVPPLATMREPMTTIYNAGPDIVCKKKPKLEKLDPGGSEFDNLIPSPAPSQSPSASATPE